MERTEVTPVKSPAVARRPALRPERPRGQRARGAGVARRGTPRAREGGDELEDRSFPLRSRLEAPLVHSLTGLARGEGDEREGPELSSRGHLEATPAPSLPAERGTKTKSVRHRSFTLRSFPQAAARGRRGPAGRGYSCEVTSAPEGTNERPRLRTAGMWTGCEGAVGAQPGAVTPVKSPTRRRARVRRLSHLRPGGRRARGPRSLDTIWPVRDRRLRTRPCRGA